VAIHAVGADPRLLAEHRRARHRGDDQIDPGHWDGLPNGRTRAVTLTDPASTDPTSTQPPEQADPDRLEPVTMLLEHPGMGIAVARRDPRVYDRAAGLSGSVGGAA
jgi:hypothetical protein